MTETRKWSFMAAVLVLAILAGGWFLLVSPKRSDAAALRSDVATEESANARLQQKIAQLKAQQQDLPAQRAKLALFRRQVPDNPALPALIRDLTSAADKAGLDLMAIAPSEPVAVVDASVPAAAATTGKTPTGTTGTTGSTTGKTTTGTTGTTTAAPAVSSQLYQVPLVIRADGSYFEIEQLLNKIEGFRRSFLVTGFTIETVKEPKPAKPGPVEIAITGRVFVSTPFVTSATAAPAPAATTAAK